MTATNQLWLSRCKVPSTSVSNYWPPIGGPLIDGSPATTEANVSAAVTANGGTLKSMYVRLTAAPGSGKSRTVRVVVNGTPSGTLTATISNTATTATITGNVTLSSGDKVSIEDSPSGTPAASDVFVALEYAPATDNYYLYLSCWAGGAATLSNSANGFVAALGPSGSSSVGTRLPSVMPFAGTVREVRLELTVAPGAGKSRAFDLLKNGSSIGTYTISDAATSVAASGLSLSLAAGDTLMWKETPSGTPASARARWGIVIEPTSAGKFVLSAAANFAVNDITSTFISPSMGSDNSSTPFDATEANVQMDAHIAFSLSALYFVMDSDINTSTEAVTATVRKNASNGNLTCQITGTSANDTGHTDNFAIGDLLAVNLTSATNGDMADWAISLACALTPASPQSITLPLVASTSAVYSPSLGLHSSGLAVAVGHPVTPYLSVYQWQTAGGLGSRYAPPSPALSAMAVDPNWHPSAQWICFASGGELHVYPWNMVTGFGARVANPSPIPAGIVHARWSPNGQVMFITHAATPYVTAYRWTAGGFGSVYSAPTQKPAGLPSSIACHPDNNAVGITFQTTPYFYVWDFTVGVGWGTRYAAPFESFSAYVTSLAWNPDGDVLIVGFWASPRVYIYDWAPGYTEPPAITSPILSGVVQNAAWNPDGLSLALALSFGLPSHVVGAAVVVEDAGTPYAPFPDPAEVPEMGPGAFAAGVAWHPEGTDLVVTSDGEPYIRAWPWDAITGFGTAYADPSAIPEADADPATYPPPNIGRPAWGGLIDQHIHLPLVGPTAVVYGIRVGDVIELPLVQSTSIVYGIELHPHFEEPTPLGELARTLEIEFDPGVWTDVSDYFDSASSLEWKRGVSEDREPYVGTMDVDLSNASEDFTQGLRDAPWFNKLLPGIGVRYSITYAGTNLPRFRGTITDIGPSFGTEGSDEHRISLSCEAMTGLLARTDKYTITTLTNSDVDQCIANIIEAEEFEVGGVTAVLYLLDDSAMVLPYFWQRGNALADMVAAAQCDLGGVLWEDGSGRIRFTAIANLLGKYASPSHRWGQLVSPDGDIEPDWRWTSQTARQSITTQVFDAGIGTIDLYTHPYNAGNSLSPLILEGHPLVIAGEFETIPLTVSDFALYGGTSVCDGNDQADGGGSSSPMEGHLFVDGTSFRVIVYSGAPSGYLTSLIIQGTGVVVSAEGLPKLTYSKAIPYIPGLPEATAIDLAYLEQSDATLGYAQGLLRGNRVPAPWLELAFTIDSDEKARSLLRAEINDLVLYEGTGNFRERIREWYRIQSLEETTSSEELIEYKVKLSPAHLIRDPHNCAYSSFLSFAEALDDVGLEIGEVATNGDQWIAVDGVLTFTSFTPDPLIVDLNGGDQVVIVEWSGMLDSFYAVDDPGVGCVFRANSDGTQRWEVKFDPDGNRIYVWNTVDELVDSYDWTPADSGEIEVRALADNIRVYLNARPEPIIELRSRTRFQSNEYAGLCAALSSNGGTAVSDFCAQRA